VQLFFRQRQLMHAIAHYFRHLSKLPLLARIKGMGFFPPLHIQSQPFQNVINSEQPPAFQVKAHRPPKNRLITIPPGTDL